MFKEINILKESKYSLKSRYFLLVLIATIYAILDVVQYKYMWQIFDVVKTSEKWSEVINYVLIFTSIVIVYVVMGYFKKKVSARFKLETIKTGFDNMNEKYRFSDATAFRKMDTSYFSSRVKSDLENVSNYYTDGILSFVLNILKIVLMLGISIIINWKITIGFVITVPILIYVYITFLKRMTEKAQEYQESAAGYFSNWSGQVEFLDEIVQSGDYQNENRKFSDVFKQFFSKFLDFTKFNQLFNLSMTGVTILCQLIIISLGAYFVNKGQLSIGELLVIVAYGQQIQQISLSLFQFGEQKAGKVASTEKLNELYSVSSIEEGKNKIEKVESIDADISYSFTNEINIYKDMKVSLKKGNIYGISGDNGKGKTTLIRLLTGVYKENEFSKVDVRVNGKDMKEIDSVYFRRKNVAFVSQFPKSIYEKSAEYLAGEYDVEVDTVKEKIDEYNIDSRDMVIDFLNNKKDIPIKDLSGGDRTFTSILGAIFSGKDFIIMDEPTANLDTARCEWLMNILNKIKKDKIILIISHDKNMFEIFDENINII
ncbi:MAG: ABC transporter ATP-binding protein [Ezakiella sp.]|uniref:ABC transporter ATP-binding protein n=1 Tax=Ezakiella sp. TaxID=1935205 RepID=UPI0029753569|nr:ABC transporter ATP-binding protein [Ezakiella sp.]MDD7730802.1 ABC transporter ATP-binding protein [Eubacteriales bacterium]MDY6079949.1 ABC transporter ATP-binding protein [Ezakiella sp.]